jgi:hypothetical protein
MRLDIPISTITHRQLPNGFRDRLRPGELEILQRHFPGLEPRAIGDILWEVMEYHDVKEAGWNSQSSESSESSLDVSDMILDSDEVDPELEARPEQEQRVDPNGVRRMMRQLTGLWADQDHEELEALLEEGISPAPDARDGERISTEDFEARLRQQQVTSPSRINNWVQEQPELLPEQQLRADLEGLLAEGYATSQSWSSDGQRNVDSEREASPNVSWPTRSLLDNSELERPLQGSARATALELITALTSAWREEGRAQINQDEGSPGESSPVSSPNDEMDIDGPDRSPVNITALVSRLGGGPRNSTRVYVNENDVRNGNVVVRRLNGALEIHIRGQR